MSPAPRKTLPITLIRKDDDPVDFPRVTIGNIKDQDGIYLVFRGGPKEAVNILTQALEKAKTDLPAGKYDDRRGQLRVF